MLLLSQVCAFTAQTGRKQNGWKHPACYRFFRPMLPAKSRHGNLPLFQNRIRQSPYGGLIKLSLDIARDVYKRQMFPLSLWYFANPGTLLSSCSSKRKTSPNRPLAASLPDRFPKSQDMVLNIRSAFPRSSFGRLSSFRHAT